MKIEKTKKQSDSASHLTITIKPMAVAIILMFTPWLTTSSFAAPLVLIQQPAGNAAKQPAPNVIITIDDSGSMGGGVGDGSGTSKMVLLKAALSQAFSKANIPDGRMRLAWQAMWNSGNTNISAGSTNSMRLFGGPTGSVAATHRANFDAFVNGLNPVANTPSHLMIRQAGEYMRTTGINNPFATEPGVANSPLLECRKSYHIFMTDGEWNGVSSDGDGVVYDGGNADGGGITSFPDGTSYNASSAQTNVYKDNVGASYLSTLSDVAFHFWATDLQPSIPNGVQPNIKQAGSESISGISLEEYWNPKNDPATWQHLTQYTIGFGSGAVSWSGGPQWDGSTDSNYNTLANGYQGLVAGNTTWGNVFNGNRTQELWHMALNGRGKYYPARSGTALTNAFKEILDKINTDTSKPLVSIAASTSYLSSNSNVYLAGYDASTWTGTISARSINDAGVVGTTDIWDAASKLNTKTSTQINNRVVLTSNGSNGIPFRWDKLSGAQQSALNASDNLGQKRVDYLRGSRSDEVTNGGALRNRGSLLGDIVNSNLWLVGKPRGPSNSTSYATFKITQASRTPVLYVGANDGMLHGFNTSGDEVLAYIPKGFLKGTEALINAITKTNYGTSETNMHRYFVDGQPFSGDVEISTGVWKTILVSGLGAGGKGYMALDVTNPNFTDASSSSVVLTDTTDGANDEIGHIFAGPVTDAFHTSHSIQITKMNNGRPAIVLGNGYNSTNEDATLIIQYLDGDKKIVIIKTNRATNNGLSAPQLIDVNGDGKVDMAYAGDLQGNLWKFDLTSSAESGWKVAFSGNPLVNTSISLNGIQAITTAPTWLPHPLGGVMIAFGTGRSLAVGDLTNTQQQTIYGIYDNSAITLNSNLTAVTITDGTAVTDKLQLVEQTLSAVNANGYGTTSSDPVLYTGTNAKRGWFANFPNPGSGERVTVNPNILDASYFYVLSQIPAAEATNEESCTNSASGQGFLNVLGILNGTAPKTPIFEGTSTLYGRTRISGMNGILMNMPYDRAKFITPSSGGGAGVGGVGTDPTFNLFGDEGVNAGWKQLR